MLHYLPDFSLKRNFFIRFLSLQRNFIENFFLYRYGISYPKQGDLLVDGLFLFEVGGKSKGFSQISDLPDSYVAADEIEIGFGNKIPLWLFGLLY